MSLTEPSGRICLIARYTSFVSLFPDTSASYRRLDISCGSALYLADDIHSLKFALYPVFKTAYMLLSITSTLWPVQTNMLSSLISTITPFPKYPVTISPVVYFMHFSLPDTVFVLLLPNCCSDSLYMHFH